MYSTYGLQAILDLCKLRKIVAANFAEAEGHYGGARTRQGQEVNISGMYKGMRKGVKRFHNAR